MNTEKTNMEQLLSLYFDGQANEVQEQQIKDYFKSGDVAKEHKKYAALFGFYTLEKNTKPRKQFHLKPKSNKWILFRVAAMFVVSGVFIGVFLTQKNNTNLGTYQTPEEALVATQNALSILATELNNGNEGIAYINEYTKIKQNLFKK